MSQQKQYGILNNDGDDEDDHVLTNENITEICIGNNDSVVTTIAATLSSVSAGGTTTATITAPLTHGLINLHGTVANYVCHNNNINNSNNINTNNNINNKNNNNNNNKNSNQNNRSNIRFMKDDDLPLCFQEIRHQQPIKGIDCEAQSWRIRERMKTVSVALVLCLNIGVDPPDIVKIQPCARLECWIDPSSVSPPKAMELIGANLQKQYERWQPRARYKKVSDPTVDDVKKLCTSLRRNAKEERVLFHYNGHGVPKPTANGEIWVFNKTYTQYIPLSIYDLQAWMGAPSIYVYDCSNAGMIINLFNQFAEQHEREMEKATGGNRQSPSNSQNVTYKNCIQLAACAANQILPMNAQLPADLFTSCLTTPIKTALKWHTMHNPLGLANQINMDLIDRIPGQLNDRRTMLGELNWIFTAITDTIAWNMLEKDLFQKLFRQDLLVASLFRNFLLAERILRSYDCTPQSSPKLPLCYRNQMWSAWDLAVDLALQQLPNILEKNAPYQQLPFFEEQLTAFQVWLEQGNKERSPPEQLPIVLQVLLSQVHRMRALELLGRFLNLGPWAVNLALGVGIFPYVLKLLQSSAKELRPILVFIWAKILAVDSTCQIDLVKDYKYFLNVLQDYKSSKKQRTLAAFVLASIVNNFLLGQTSALQGSLVSICLEQLYTENNLLRQWLIICLGQLWQNFAKARWSGVRDMAHEKLYPLLKDNVPEVRASAVFALGTYISSVTERSEHANNIDRNIALMLLTTVMDDMSPLVRLELIAALQWMVILFESQFVAVYLQESSTISETYSINSYYFSHYNNLNLNHASNNGGLTNNTRTNATNAISTNQVLPVALNNFNTGCGGGNGTNNYDLLNYFTLHNSLDRNNMKRGFSSSSIPNLSVNINNINPTIGIGRIYLKLLHGIFLLARDPFPKVAETAQKLIEYIRNSAVYLIAAKEATTEKYISPSSVQSASSLSLPPSPNTRTSYLGESPPNAQQSPQINVMSNSTTGVIICGSGGDKKLLTTQHGTSGGIPHFSNRVVTSSPINNKKRTSSMCDERDTTTNQSGSNNINQSSVQNAQQQSRAASNNFVITNNLTQQQRKSCGASGTVGQQSSIMKSIVTTNFISWSISQFARSCDNYCNELIRMNYSQNESNGSCGSGNGSGSSSTSSNNSIESNKDISLQSPTVISKQQRSNSIIMNSLQNHQQMQQYPIDLYSPQYLAQKSRFSRNKEIRRLALEQQKRAIFHKIDMPIYSGKTQFTPTIVKLLPYEDKIAVAYKNTVKVYDWNKSTSISYIPPEKPNQFNLNNILLSGSNNSNSISISGGMAANSITTTNSRHHHKSYSMSSTSGSVTSTGVSPLVYITGSLLGAIVNESGDIVSNNFTGPRVSTIEFLNSHDIPLILVGYEDGTVRIWQEQLVQEQCLTVNNQQQQSNSKLITAWQCLPFSHRTKEMGGVTSTWHQKSQHLFFGGYTNFLRLWDVKTELKICDIPTGTHAYVRTLSSSPNEIVAAGCSDGSVRLFDKRCSSNENRIMTYREDTCSILTACLRDNCESLVTGCTQGKIRLFDIRMKQSVQNWKAGNDISAISVHTEADILACGSQSITIYGLDGRQQTTLRVSESFMGPRIGHTSCLSFHPYKVDLAGGFVDNSVAVYSSSGYS
ncbi:regulatory-associated protein of mTOR [Condylostylus longicornis]|uniref:regulatory-associated protein of mTOR n=1 Tax=Condylostylus longicornis TaxID=2530218 RepID=UPI00244E4809|nr:regulatory-associated protein of mTOR [Condylostylus longicornis]XP_055384001.1 regulatory-associated protein of mTOR [Condylostylus longicornis]XP_055384002.1 regulatory-associated protein of mTOR [Condylostylus longicornis]XP_055384003.1 regulatory-associated protein of mTOR [Condylostylus longicornis]XP_055384004.1 regulatory-associated protein of mTOR [Condylostylus longicornis]XP_055384005.1 regulatory-associated protein of mTOR [Condylostylus longicornis]XP_055384006.1 regulatory-ass